MGRKMEVVTDFIFLGSKITADGDCSHEIKRHLLLGRKAMTNLDSRDIILLTDVLSSQSCGFSSSHVWMWNLDHKESWAPKNWCFWNMMLEKTLESTLDNNEVKPVNAKGNQSWIFIGRTDAESEAPILWPHDVKSQVIWKDPDAGKDWKQEEKGMTEDEMLGWHHWLMDTNLCKLGAGDGQGGLVCCSLWSQKESDMTERLNNNKPFKSINLTQ